MKPEFRTTRIEAQPIVGIRATSTMDRLAEVMGPLFGEVHAHIGEQGATPAGMPLTIYHTADGDTLEIECAIPVAAPMDGTERIGAGVLPGGTVAAVTHLGPYENLHHTWAALTEWMRSEGLERAGAPWEVYVTDPGAEPDVSKWRTDIFFPVR